MHKTSVFLWTLSSTRPSKASIEKTPREGAGEEKTGNKNYLLKKQAGERSVESEDGWISAVDEEDGDDNFDWMRTMVIIVIIIKMIVMMFVIMTQ